jgi:hypothetical protein
VSEQVESGAEDSRESNGDGDDSLDSVVNALGLDKKVISLPGVTLAPLSSKRHLKERSMGARDGGSADGQ